MYPHKIGGRTPLGGSGKGVWMFSLSIATGLLTASAFGGQEFAYNPVKPVATEAEKKDVNDLWVLDFNFRQPRYILTNIPGEGRKLVWYMVYKITNRTGEPRQFVPRFEIVTNPGSPPAGQVVDAKANPTGLFSRTFKDVLLQKAELQVQEREGRERNFHNSVTVSKPLEPTPKEGSPIERYGVVFWKDIPMGETKKFNIYITGLSNGYRRIPDPADKKKEVILRKTLELRFDKAGDEFNADQREIRLEGIDWVYR
jgi:hypothetical protein